MRFGVLGPLEVLDDDGSPVDVGGRQPRLVLAALLAADGRPVSADALVDTIWVDQPPASALSTLQSYISRLRRRLEGDGSGAELTFGDGGYRLEVDRASVDMHQFEALADEGRSQLEAGRADLARPALGDALGLWRGPAFLDLADGGVAVGLATRLDERRSAALEDRIQADLDLGRSAAVIGELSALAAEHPLREGLHAKLALALYRSGRQADALRALADAGRTLREELGIEPGREIRELEAAILGHDPDLDPGSLRGDAPEPGPVATPDPTTAEPTSRGAGLVGRSAELADLVAALDAAPSDARFVVIEGEPGIGKTRLAGEFRSVAMAQGSLAVWGRADESGAAPALWPWLPLLRAVVDQQADVPDSLTELVTGAAPLLAGQGAAVQFERFEALAEVLERTGAARPVVVLLDDLQWADDTSLELLSYLSSRLSRGVVVVATVRPPEVGRSDAVTDTLAAIARRPGSRRIQLHGLSAEDTTELLRTLGPEDVPATVSIGIHQRAEGNPFYAIELARLFDEEGHVDEVPANVGDVIRRRLMRLPEDTSELLTVAAVTGRDIDLHLVARAADLDLVGCVDLIEPAVVNRLLIDGDRPGSLRFSHALVREVLLDGLTSLRRARLHLNVANAIEQGGAGTDDAEILAEHLWRAAPMGVGVRAAEALERAADVAVSRISYTAAAEMLQRAVQLRRATATTDDDFRAELAAIVHVLEVTQTTRYFQGADRQVLNRAGDLAERFGMDDLRRTLFWFRWAGLSTSGRIDEAAPLALDYLEVTAGNDRPEVRASGEETYATALWGAGRIAESAAGFDRAMALFAEASPALSQLDLEQRLITSQFQLMLHGLLGDWPVDDVFADFDTLIDDSPAMTVPSICGFAGTTALCLGRWDEVDRYARVAEEVDPHSQFAFWGGQLVMFRGMVEVRAGRIEAGLATFDGGRDRYVGIGARSGLAAFAAGMATCLVEQGRLEAAAPVLTEARTELDTYRERWNEPFVLLAEATLAHACGDVHRAEEQIRQAIRVAREQASMNAVQRASSWAEQVGIDIDR